jgi:DNA polymerase-3 subunit epsilon
MSRLAFWRPPPASEDRWVVVDTETTGLDPQRDALLAIGAVAIHRGRLRPRDRFECTLQHTGPVDRVNVLIHGLGTEARAGGRPAGDALRAWQAWAGEAPRFAFHAGFDRDVLRRALRLAECPSPRRRWLDVGCLAAALHPEMADRRHGLDDWLEAFGLTARERHSAGADALATAELLLCLYADAGRPARLQALESRIQRSRKRPAPGAGA